jgi:phosphohistidine phosphatase
MESAHSLMLVRHAKSSWASADLADHDRPLNGRGRRDAEALGRYLAERNVAPSVVLCSTAVRARETWAQAERGGATAAEVQYLDEVYDASAGELLEVVRGLPESAQSALLLGHAPGVPALVEILAADRPAGADGEEFPTCAVAILTVPVPWADAARGGATVESFDAPRG